MSARHRRLTAVDRLRIVVFGPPRLPEVWHPLDVVVAVRTEMARRRRERIARDVLELCAGIVLGVFLVWLVLS